MFKEYKNLNKCQPFKIKALKDEKGTHQTFHNLLDVQQKGVLSSIFPEQCFENIYL